MSNEPSAPPDPQKLLDAAVAGLEATADATDLGSIAQKLPEYEFDSCIGRGGMGTVYKATDRRLGRTVAIKVIDHTLARDPAFAERFAREARALARLQHPHILTVFDFGERDGLCWLVTEFVDGMNLRQLLQMGRLPPPDALKLLPQICDALQFAHDHGVVHRDVKPENILLDQQGRVRIADFGLVRLVQREPGSPTLTQTHQALGTPHYMAPEQVSEPSQVDHRADIYSLGVIAYELLTGKLPMGLFDKPSSAAAVGPAVDEAVLKSLQSAPEKRYQKVSEFQKDLAGPATGGTAVPPPVAPGMKIQRLPLFGLLGLFAAAMSYSVLHPWILYNESPRLGRMLLGGLTVVSVAALLTCPVTGLLAIQQFRRRGGDLRGLLLAVAAAWIVPVGIADAALLVLAWDGRYPEPADAVLLAMLFCFDGLLLYSLYLGHAARLPGQDKAAWRKPMLGWATAVVTADLVVLVWLAAMRRYGGEMWRFAFVVGAPMVLLLSSAAVLGLRWWLLKRPRRQSA